MQRFVFSVRPGDDVVNRQKRGLLKLQSYLVRSPGDVVENDPGHRNSKMYETHDPRACLRRIPRSGVVALILAFVSSKWTRQRFGCGRLDVHYQVFLGSGLNVQTFKGWAPYYWESKRRALATYIRALTWRHVLRSLVTQTKLPCCRPASFATTSSTL